MSDLSRYKKITALYGADYYLVDEDIMLIVPAQGFVDNAAQARASVEFQNDYARKLGKPCANIIVMSAVLSQDAETRRIYNEQPRNGLYFGAALVVDNRLSRAIASFLIGMSQNIVPIKLFDSIDKAIEWLRTIRPR